MENWQWITLVLIPTVAPAITLLINRFGSESLKTKWNIVRKVYRKAFGLSEPK